MLGWWLGTSQIMRAQICAVGMREIKSAQTKVWGNEGMTIRKMDGITFIRSMEPRELGGHSRHTEGFKWIDETKY